MASELERRELIIRFFLENPQWTLRTIANKAKVAKSTVSVTIKSFKENLNVGRKVGSGRRKGFVSPETSRKVVASLQKNPGLSNRKVATKSGCSEGLVRKIKTEAGLKTYKVQTVPDRNANKNLEARRRAKMLKLNYFQEKMCCVMDDETYVLCDFSQLPGQEFYTASERGGSKNNLGPKKSKFPKKFLVWQAICSCGDRSSNFVTSGTINSEIYVKECLQKRLLPFISKHRGSAFFWPDLASCHYSKMALDWYKDNNINFVPKEANPPNCSELRPIERYWALVKRKLKSTKLETQDMKVFKRKWNEAARTVTETTIKALMAGVPEGDC